MTRALGRMLVLVVALTCALTAHASAQEPRATPSPLEGAWQYLPDPQDQGRADGLQSGTTGEGWQPVEVPHLFDPRPDEGRFWGTVGWYRVRFRAPDAPAAQRWALRFGQVRRTAEVWLDGRRLGEHRDPYVPFDLPAGELGTGEHTLVVRVDNRKAKEPREGWWNWGGISKPVQLVPRGTVVADRPGLMPRRVCGEAGCRWRVLVDAELTGVGPGTARPQVGVQLRAPDGTVSGKAVETRPLSPGERTRVRFDVPVDGDAQLWQPGSPNLYSAVLRVRDGDTLVQEERKKVGLRTVEVKDGLLRLNGRPVELRGASIQEDAPGHGAALTDADVEWIVRELKALNANVTRAHYLLDERLLERFDEEGILVWSQAPIYHRDRLLETAAQRRTALDTVRGTVLGARSHPSVITHSVGNELSVIPDQVPGTRRFLLDARTLTRDLDPTLPASVDLLSYPGYDRQETYAKFPLLGINSYFGWYPGKKDRSTANIEDLGPFLRATQRKYPGAALIVTEFGAESTFDGPASVKETYAFQTDYVRRVLDVVERTPRIGGAIYWTLREFAVKPDWDGGAKRTGIPRDGIHNKGLITYEGQRKPAWDVLAADAQRTALWRGSTEVAEATGTRVPEGRGGLGDALPWLALVGGLIVLLGIPVWAFRGLMRDSRGGAGAPPPPTDLRGRQAAEEDREPVRSVA
ncbi:glycoside hydrolase family 2 protein [Conexibacter sp. SYSU D00693]|uniref:glycoside hydrolase family 2 protein n=1 Tax=Conexibacter sp. SYSU D00693 TaxID=2812560 RepID=UPI00196B6DD6|nr:glycoside hydrolase family 2 TIM barrel-domain containing protein [Conexibacter sp. SYSU D00693]